MTSRFGLGPLSTRAYAERFGADWREVFPAAMVQRAPPACIDSSDRQLESKLAKSFPAAGVLTLQGGCIAGPEGWVFGEKKVWLPDHSWYGECPAEASPRMSQRAARRSGTCLTLASNWSFANYGHLLLDSIPRLRLFTGAGFSFEDVDHIYCPVKNVAKGAALLGRYGVPIEKCIFEPVAHSEGLQFDTLIAPTFPGVRRNYPHWVPDFLRTALPKAAAPPARRLYVTRGSGTRQLANERDLLGLLADYEFEFYDPSLQPEPWLDFSQATAVIGAHGAGLTDLAFCAADTTVLELLPSDHIYPYYCSLSHAAGLNYGYLVGKSERQRRAGARGPSPYDFVVSEPQFVAGLRWVGKH
ncbi:MAG: glycosyltransferase family 61 protein [Proteobacteria bacterium]|nr:glycosyltransferase family 61 protein [Pseudomonadota bacterium]